LSALAEFHVSGCHVPLVVEIKSLVCQNYSESKKLEYFIAQCRGTKRGTEVLLIVSLTHDAGRNATGLIPHLHI